ncbi:MAG: cysteine--tRNA ligase [Capsulimonadaceae bacterium]|nr:cysteine--tRNA ligase [Capsulimonadaceae bacterium]
MPITVWNTLTHAKEEFSPRDKGKVSIYACGLTPQGPAHLGHLRGAVVFDAIRRWFTARGFDVTMVQNFTDVDDKIIRKSNDEGVPAAELAERFAKAYLEDWAALGITPVTFVKVTENMESIVQLTKDLVDNGHAYATPEGDVYFSVKSFAEYGKLSRRDPAEMEAGARIDVDPSKRDPMDFALWKAQRPGEPAWPSPWGLGRPGWHIECSALSLKFLGKTFDIHAGGVDLVFPHHENEIAQTEAATGEQFARYWMHWGSVNLAGEKMSKSVGNFFTIRELLGAFSAEALRLYVLSSHYRSPIDYAPERVRETSRALDRVRTALDVAAQISSGVAGKPVQSYVDQFGAAMDDDFNTAGAIGVVYETLADLNREIARPEADRGTVSNLASTITLLLSYLGVNLAAQSEPSSQNDDLPRLMDLAIAWRKAARAAKQYALSDQIRDDLKSIGIILEDRPHGTTWRREA